MDKRLLSLVIVSSKKKKKEKAEDLQSSIRLSIRDRHTHEIEKKKTEVNSFLSHSCRNRTLIGAML